VRDANRRFNLKLPEDGHYTTVAGFLLAEAGRLLKPGDRVEHEGARFRVERVDRRRIRWVRFTPAPPAAEPEGGTSSGSAAAIQTGALMFGTSMTHAGVELSAQAEFLIAVI
jgi:hypothetical protein